MTSPLAPAIPALKLCLLFSAGIVVGDWGALPLHQAAFLPLLSAALWAASVAKSRSRGSASIVGFLALCSLVCFAGVLGSSYEVWRGSRLLSRVESGEVVVAGSVVSPSQIRGSRARFTLESNALLSDGTSVPFRARILVSMKVTDLEIHPDYGMVLLLRGTISRPREARNPGEFNQRRFYEANGISHLLSAGGVVIMDTVGGSWLMREMVVPVRRFMLAGIDSSIGGQEGEYLKGVLLGERGGLSPEVREAFTRAGVSHILAVSGSNVAVVAAFMFLVAELLRVPRRMRAVIAGTGVCFYMLLVGDQPPVVRATIMALVLLAGTVIGKRANPLNALGVAGLIILAADTRQLFDVGFQLSFTAVLAIVYLYPILERLIRRLPADTMLMKAASWLFRLCAVSLVATLGTAPLTAGYFGRVSLIGLAANIAVVPASGFSLLLGFLALPLSVVSPAAAQVYHDLNALILRLTLDLTAVAGGTSFASVDTFRFTALDSLWFYTLLLLVFHIDQGAARRSLLLVFLVTINIRIFVPPRDGFGKNDVLRVSVLDVGQGDAVLLELPDGATILVDAGPRTRTYDTGKSTVVPFMKRRGIGAIDLLVATHPHSDHIGGVPAVLREMEVRAVMDCGKEVESDVYREYRMLIDEEQCRYSEAASGMMLTTFRDVRIYILAPEERTRNSSNVNDGSVVIRLKYGATSVLLTGDAETGSEHDMVRRYGPFLNSSLLKAGHHGSRTSSSEPFLSAVRPWIALISVGRPNLYRHPSPVILDRFGDNGIQYLRTDEEGAIILESDGVAFRRVHWRGK